MSRVTAVPRLQNYTGAGREINIQNTAILAGKSKKTEEKRRKLV
jgi:hypothetical protein